MLEKQIKGFLQYCKVCGFRARSLQALTIRLNDFNRFLREKRISRVQSVNYSYLSAFVADFKSPSIHVKKPRIWSLRQFYHYLKLNSIVRENIALGLPYPKIEKTVPKFLTIKEYNRILNHFTDRVTTPFGLRNLVIILFLGLIGIRTGAIIALNVQDIDLVSGLAWIKEKGSRKRIVVLPETISILLYKYLENMGRSHGPIRRNNMLALIDAFHKELSDIKELSDSNHPVPKNVAYKLLRSINQSSWHGQRNFLIIAMLWALGLRVGELTSLKVKSFEPDHDRGNKIGLLRVRGKNRQQRALFVVDKLYDALAKYIALPQSPKKKNDPLFPIEAGTAISTDRVYKMIKEYCQSAKIKNRITPHVLRHSFATEMYHQGIPLQAIQAMIGHSKKAETSIYIHVSDQLQKAALEQITLEGGLLWR